MLRAKDVSPGAGASPSGGSKRGHEQTMIQPQTSLVYFRHRDLAEWYEIVQMQTVGEAGVARRRALIGALDDSDISECRDADLLRAVADLLSHAHHRGDAVSADLLRCLPQPRRARFAAAAEAQVAQLYLSAPDLDDDLALLLDWAQAS
ncbi:hypothetical protein [Limimaricola soesokkakensis]|uniref:hypothetical protein n=2 Tax=Limimaricola soesokkakensis TaxID=1343159 RepID=UPI00405A087A